MGVSRLPTASDHWYRDHEGTLCRIVQSRHKIWLATRNSDEMPNRRTTRDIMKQSIGLVRYEQLKWYFHVSNPTLTSQFTDKDCYKKLDPLSSRLQNAFQRYFVPGTKVAVDEMIRFFGRSKHTVKMKSKPIKQRYKIRGLCCREYTYSFLYYSSVHDVGIVGINWKEIPGLNPTASAVYHLAKTLPYHDKCYQIIMDNLFTNVPLLKALRELGIEAAGTTRINATGFPTCLNIDREKSKNNTLWGQLSWTGFAVWYGKIIIQFFLGRLFMMFIKQLNVSVVGLGSAAQMV